MKSLITIDGSEGEGGGQVLRTSLALSTIAGQPFHITCIRGNRKKPGLMRQHLTAVRSAGQLCGASLVGAELHSQELTFTPAQAGAMPGVYHFAIGTAGSTSLVLQTILPPLLMAIGDSTVTLEGGTHNPMAPPFPFLQDVFVPLLRRMGAQIELELECPGFAPAGGGKVRLQVTGTGKLNSLEILERGEIQNITATAAMAGGLSGAIAQRELQVVGDAMQLAPNQLFQRTIIDSPGPGNYLGIQVQSQHITELFSAVGEVGKRAEAVAFNAVKEAQKYLEAKVPVGSHLADQLLLPMALAGSGAFITSAPTLHTQTNIAVIQRFLNVNIMNERIGEKRIHKITIT